MTTYIYTSPNRLVIERDGYATIITDETLDLHDSQKRNVYTIGSTSIAMRVVSIDDIENLGNYTTKLQPKIEYRPGMKVKGKTLIENNPPWRTVIYGGGSPFQINSYGEWQYGTNTVRLADDLEYEVIYVP